MDHVVLSIEDSVATVTLNRPELHNAFNEVVIQDLISCFDEINENHSVRAVVLQSTGKSFSAGADLNWMRKMVSYSRDENLEDSKQLALMLNKLYNLNKPTIAKIQGSAFGGAVGLVACCDISVASKLSKFCLSEVKLGLIPATISPYIVEVVGPRMAKRLFMTAEVISARRARRIGLVDETVSEEDLNSEIEKHIQNIKKNGPLAVSLAKQLVNTVKHQPMSSELMDKTSKIIADVRVSEEGQEGLHAFLEKRSANWVKSNDR